MLLASRSAGCTVTITMDCNRENIAAVAGDACAELLSA